MPRKKRDIPEYTTRPSDTGFFYVHWSENRRTQRKSTGTKDEAEAQRYLADFIAARHGPPDEPTVSAILDGYLKDRKDVVIDYERLRYAAKALKGYFGHMAPRQITPPYTRAYEAWRGVKPGTLLKELRTLRAALNWGVKHKWITERPDIEMPTPPLPRERHLSKPEFRQLIEGCGSHHVYIWCLLAVFTAGRKVSLLTLKWSRVDFETGLIDLNEPGRAATKKKRAVVPMNDTLRAALLEARELAQTDYVIEWNGKPVKSIKRAWREAVRRAGLKNVTPHDMRRTAATWAAMDGKDMQVIAELLGHDDITTTRRVYAKFSPEYLRDIVDTLDVPDLKVPQFAHLRGNADGTR